MGRDMLTCIFMHINMARMHGAGTCRHKQELLWLGHDTCYS
jgi:hypothetical protein